MSEYIKREDAIKVIADYFDLIGYARIFANRLLNKVPSADVVEPKRGEWIDAEIRHKDGVLPIQVCSECKTFYPLEYTGGGHRFCPNCGARMKGADGE